jgi:hypothetical protein
MTWISQFLATNGNAIIVGILIIAGGALLVTALTHTTRLIAIVLLAILRFVYWALVGWWASKIRRWITGSPW